MNPVISIILPVLNEAGLLAETLAGLPAAPDLEIILVDGGSADGTWELTGRWPHVRCLRAPRGRGCQMNAGARIARGQLLAFLHADTRFEPAHLAALRRAAADPTFAAGAFELSLTAAAAGPALHRLGRQLAQPPLRPALRRPGPHPAPRPVLRPGRLRPPPARGPGPGVSPPALHPVAPAPPAGGQLRPPLAGPGLPGHHPPPLADPGPPPGRTRLHQALAGAGGYEKFLGGGG